MSVIDEMQIDLRSLTKDVTRLDYRLQGDVLCELAKGHEVHGGDIAAELTLTKVGEGAYELRIDMDGQLEIPCDRCLEDMQQHVRASESLHVRLVPDTACQEDQDEDTICVSERNALLDTAWPVMEAALLAVPIQHVHETGLCERAMVKALEEHSAARSGEGEAGTAAADDGWKEKLKQIKIN